MDYNPYFPSSNGYINSNRSESDTMQSNSNISMPLNVAWSIPSPEVIPMDQHVVANLSNISWTDMTNSVNSVYELYKTEYEENAENSMFYRGDCNILNT